MSGAVVTLILAAWPYLTASSNPHTASPDAVLRGPLTPSWTPTFAISGSQFTVNGTPMFLLFLSYFDAMRRSNDGDRNAGGLDTDFQYIKSQGFDGVRIFPLSPSRKQTQGSSSLTIRSSCL